jgi:addiction module RelB/DinJ family antitoxin
MQRVKTNLNVRVDKNEKETAMLRLKNIGMDMSTAIGLFIHQINIQPEFPLKLYIEPQFAQSVYDELDKADEARALGAAVYTPAEDLHAKAKEKYGV